MVGKSTSAKLPKRSKFAITTCYKNSELFLSYDTGVDFSSRDNFPNLGSVAKVSVPVRSIIPCVHTDQGWILSESVTWSCALFVVGVSWKGARAGDKWKHSTTNSRSVCYMGSQSVVFCLLYIWHQDLCWLSVSRRQTGHTTQQIAMLYCD